MAPATAWELAATAATEGDLEQFRELRSYVLSNTWHYYIPRFCVSAAHNGHINILEILATHCDPEAWAPEVCSAAAARGHVAVLQRLRSQGCAWDGATFSNACLNRFTHVPASSIYASCGLDVDVQFGHLFWVSRWSSLNLTTSLDLTLEDKSLPSEAMADQPIAWALPARTI